MARREGLCGTALLQIEVHSIKMVYILNYYRCWRRPGGFAVRLRVVVPHGRVGAAAGQLAQQAGPRDVPRSHAPDARLPNHLREPPELELELELELIQSQMAQKSMLRGEVE